MGVKIKLTGNRIISRISVRQSLRTTMEPEEWGKEKIFLKLYPHGKHAGTECFFGLTKGLLEMGEWAKPPPPCL